MRVGEAVGLILGNLKSQKHTAIVTGKSNQERVVHFDQVAWLAIREYHRQRNTFFEKAAPL